jgi:hypothetical protein
MSKEIKELIECIVAEENKMMHGCDNGGSYMYYTPDGHYVSINQIYRILKEKGL